MKTTTTNDSIKTRCICATVVLMVVLVVAMMVTTALALPATGQANLPTTGCVVTEGTGGTATPTVGMGGDSAGDNPEAANRDKSGTSAPSENKRAPQVACFQPFAEHVSFATERAGFEPAKQGYTPFSSLANCRLQPLGHLSKPWERAVSLHAPMPVSNSSIGIWFAPR
jgi:hypothetical protein